MTDSQWQKRLPELESIMKEAERHQVSRAVGSPIPGVNAFSAPVFNLQGDPTLVITATDRDDRLPGRWDSPTAAAVASAARELTERLGGDTPLRPGS